MNYEDKILSKLRDSIDPGRKTTWRDYDYNETYKQRRFEDSLIKQRQFPKQFLERLPERFSERLPERFSERLPERFSERLPERFSERLPERLPERLSERLPERFPKRFPERFPEQTLKQTPEQTPKQILDTQETIRRRWPFVILLCVGLFAVAFSGFQLIGKPPEVLGNQDISQYDSVLSASEKQEWQTKEAKPREVFIQLNVKMSVIDGNKADLRLINPPYSRYRYWVELTLKGEDTVLYQIGIEPGTVFEYVELNRTLEVGNYNATVLYTFFDGKGKPAGSRQVDVTLSVAEEELPDSQNELSENKFPENEASEKNGEQPMNSWGYFDNR